MSDARVEGLDVDALLRLLVPDADESQLLALAAAAGEDRITDLGSLRRALGAVNRSTVPTRVTVRFGAADVVVTRVRGLTLALDRSDAAVAKRILEDRIYEPHLSPAVERLLRPGMRVVDVGANVGYYTLLAARLVGPSGHVVAVEPNSENCRLLLLSVALNGASNVELLPVALDAARGWSYFSAEIGSNGGMVAAGPALADGSGSVVPTFPLDDLVKGPVDLVKLDVEGAEGRVLAGARRLLEDSLPVVVTELCPRMLSSVSRQPVAEYLGWFADRGYRIYLADRHSYRLEPVELEPLLNGWGNLDRIEDLVLRPPSQS